MLVLDAIGQEDRILPTVKPAAGVKDARIEDHAVPAVGSNPFGVASQEIQPAQPRQDVGGGARAALDAATLLRAERSCPVTALHEADAEPTVVVVLEVEANTRDAIGSFALVPVRAVAIATGDAVTVPGKGREPHMQIGVRQVAN